MNNLRQYRAVRGVTQSQLAHRCGVSRTAIHDAETGHLSLKLATKCEEVLRVNRYALLGLDAIIGNPTKEDLKYILDVIRGNM